MFIFSFVLSANAFDIIDNTVEGGGDITTNGMNLLSARVALTNYFSARESFLLGSDDGLDDYILGIINDEIDHIETYIQAGIEYLGSEIVIDDISCFDSKAEAEVTETVSYREEGVDKSATIVHTLRLYLSPNGYPIVAADLYKEDFSGFISCSYVSEDACIPTSSVGGSRYCIIDVAEREVGYTESSSGWTKYGEWHKTPYANWCAIFVSWCANESNISTSVLPKTAGPGEILDVLNTQGRYYSFSGTVAPRAGDIFFLTEGSGPSHVGIIVGVDSNNIYVVDGNWSNKVCSRTISRTSSDLLGFGNPNYESGTHTYSYHYDTNNHWRVCDNCDYVLSTSAHTYSGYQTNTTHHWQQCTYCGYQTSQSAHTKSVVYSSNSVSHWKACLTCGAKLDNAAHTFVETAPGGVFECTVCKYRSYGALA